MTVKWNRLLIVLVLGMLHKVNDES